jgi:hypothetical protein
MAARSSQDFACWCDWCRCHARATSPDEHLPVLIRCQILNLDEFNLEAFEIVVTEVEAALEQVRVIASVPEVLGELQQSAGFHVAHPFDHML